MEGCLQTDSVHGFIRSEYIADINITFTSRFCSVLKWTVSLLISFMFGKSQLHYEKHFTALLQSLNLDNWDDLEKLFPGMTCDFSETECLGLELAVKKFYNIADIELERFYRFCEVHFVRTLIRVQCNGAIVETRKG